MGVDELLVGLVYERREEEDRGTDQGEAPEWNNLDQIVGEECTDECLEFVSYVYKTGDLKFTAPETRTFSANTIRWASMTKKFRSSWTSPMRELRVSFDNV